MRLQRRRPLPPSGPRPPPPPPRRRAARAARPARAPSPRRAHAHTRRRLGTHQAAPSARRQLRHTWWAPPASRKRAHGGRRGPCSRHPPAAGRAHLVLPTPAAPHPAPAGVRAVPTGLARRCHHEAAGEGVEGPAQGWRRAPGLGRGIPRVLSAVPAVGTPASPPPGDCPKRLLGNKGAGRGRRAQGTRRRKARTAHLPTEVPGGWGPGALGNQGAERSTGSRSIEDTRGFSPALGLRMGNSAVWTCKWEASGTATTNESAPALDLTAWSFDSFKPHKSSRLLPNQGR